MPLAEFTTRLKNLVFPPVCIMCGTECPPANGGTGSVKQSWRSDQPFCAPCVKQLTPENPLDRCLHCGAYEMANSPYPGRCRLCFDVDFRFDRAIAVGNYSGLLQQAVIRSKTREHDTLARQLGVLLGQTAERFDVMDPVQLIVPVPSHWTRRIKRGCQGSTMIAAGVSHVTGIEYSNRILYCTRRTAKQGMLSGDARRKNVRNAFSLRKTASVRGLCILVVDDVMTSAATINEVARTLMQEGARSVTVGVVARGTGQNR